jgi:Alginate lyase
MNRTIAKSNCVPTIHAQMAGAAFGLLLTAGCGAPGDEVPGQSTDEALGGSGLSVSAPPGKNFDLSCWNLQLPIGSKGDPEQISSEDLMKGYTSKYFYTDSTDGSMTFYDPEDGVTTAHSDYPRSELCELGADGQVANWSPKSGHREMSATLRATSIPSHVVVGQIHLGTGTPSSTKPLLELYYASDAQISLGIEDSPAGGQTVFDIAKVPVGTKWSYVIGMSGSTITLKVNSLSRTFTMPSSFDKEGMYFKAGNYDQSSGGGSAAATVHFYALKLSE